MIDRDTILNNLRAFAEQRPGFEPENYSNTPSYRHDMRAATRQLHDFRAMHSQVYWRRLIGTKELADAARSTRVSIDETTGAIDYCPGQYFPLEFRAGAARVLADALWAYAREHAMPVPDQAETKGSPPTYQGKSGRDWLRDYFKREFGPGIASRYF